MIEIKGKLNEILYKLDEAIKTLIPDKIYVLSIKEYKSKRSINQNDMYWKLLTDYARWGNADIRVLHNEMLCAYGVATDEYAIIPESKEIEKLEDRHYKRTSKKKLGADGVMYQYCKVMKGSHEMNTEEMSNLINGLIQEIIGSGATDKIKVDYAEIV